MIWLSFAKWDNASGRLCERKRIYWFGKWTPFIHIHWRYYSFLGCTSYVYKSPKN